MTAPLTGICIRWCEDIAIGWVCPIGVPFSEDHDVFVHHRSIIGADRLQYGDKVTFELGEHEGREVGINVRVIDD